MIITQLPITFNYTVAFFRFRAALLYGASVNASGELNSGCYDFDLTENKNREVFPINKNSTYFIETLKFKYMVENPSYLSNVLENHVPQLSFKLKSSKENLMRQPLYVPCDFENFPVNCWIKNDIANDQQLTVSLSGAIRQNENMVGIDNVYAYMWLGIYQVDGTEFSRFARGTHYEIGYNARG